MRRRYIDKNSINTQLFISIDISIVDF